MCTAAEVTCCQANEYAGSRFVEARKKHQPAGSAWSSSGTFTSSMSTPLSASEMPSRTKAFEYLPVVLSTQPVRYGPKKPPRLPTEFISAIPPAAEAPVSMDAGTVQKIVFEHQMQVAARHKPTM